jgi:hypothetical protein
MFTGNNRARETEAYMSMVALENLKPGMILADNVLDKNNRLLLGSGVELETKHLFIFRTWGIAEADIVGDDSTESPSVPDDITQEAVDAARTALLPLYGHTDLEHPAMKELFRLAILRSVRHDR